MFEKKLERVCAVGAAAAAFTVAWAPPSDARVTRIVIDQTQTPICVQRQSGVCVATDSRYEEIAGRAFGELDPHSAHNALITDIVLAPRNANGKVEYIASFLIRRPIGANVPSGLIWHDVPNRGGDVALSADLRDALDLQLLSGWQGDNAGATAIHPQATSLEPVPPRTNNQGQFLHWVKTPVLAGVTGRILGRIINRSGANQPLNVMGNPIPYFPEDSADNSTAELKTIIKETVDGKVTEGAVIPNGDWKFCYGAGASFAAPGAPTELPVRVCLGNGRTFDPALLYQLEYVAKDPYVLGTGTAAFRDVQSFFRHETQDDFGTPNPLAGKVKWAIIRGSSQSGNFTRHLIFLGMNEDEAGRIVHEGAWPLIAGRRVANNSRWGQPDGVLELYQMGSEGPQWWHQFPDRVRHVRPGGILDRCERTGTCPKIVETFGGAEVFALKMTPSWVGTDPKNDIPLPQNVRRYYLPSSTHGGGNGATTQNPGPPAVNCPGNNWGRGTLRANPVPATGLVNSMRLALRDWIMTGTEPPPSVWPRMRGPNGERTLVEATKAAMGFPSGVPGIPDSIFLPENFVFPILDYDWGGEFDHFNASGNPTNVPPPIKSVVKMMVPKVDADGNELGGVPTVQRDAPLGTYLGWNITAGPGDVNYQNQPFHAGQVCNYVGGMVPFFKTKAERDAVGDPRLSLEERYGNHAGYVAAVTKAANNAFTRGYLLAADRDTLIQQAKNSDVLCQNFVGDVCLDP